MPNVNHTQFRRSPRHITIGPHHKLRRGATVDTAQPPHPDRDHDRQDCRLYHAHLGLVALGKAIKLSTGWRRSTHSVCPAGCPDYVRQEPEAVCVLSSNGGWDE